MAADAAPTAATTATTAARAKIQRRGKMERRWTPFLAGRLAGFIFTNFVYGAKGAAFVSSVLRATFLGMVKFDHCSKIWTQETKHEAKHFNCSGDGDHDGGGCV